MYDMKVLDRLKKMPELAPEAFAAYREFARQAMKEGAIPVKYKELIALGVAMTTQCTYCLEIHKKKAKEAGVTEQEIAEAVMVTALLRCGAAVTHGAHCLE
ncbi:MAG: carboxymuconolactone decarboxylase family protein [Gemmataceae bacterium]|nr:carboxymuconolactone decarboxylase family protein [Gemmataceae bacterium]